MAVLRRIAVVVAIALLLGQGSLRSQIRYSTGQNVAPLFEGWRTNADGSFAMVFAYLNRNFDEEVDIPVGPDNLCEPSPTDCGQPTHFLNRRQKFVFSVNVPKSWPKDAKLLWTLKSRGQSESAKGWLLPEYEINDGTISENGPGGILEVGNHPPKITAGNAPQTVTLPGSAVVSVTATDDGLPKPREDPRPASTSAPQTAAASQFAAARRAGVRVRWIEYRGPVGGKVRFEPGSADPVYGAPVTVTTKASFTLPGAYVLRAIASDRQLEAVFDLPVTVKAGPSSENR